MASLPGIQQSSSFRSLSENITYFEDGVSSQREEQKFEKIRTLEKSKTLEAA